MKIITPEIISNDYNKLKKRAVKYYENGNYELSLKVIEVACNVMYNSNLRYADDELEEIVKGISNSIFDVKDDKDSKNRSKNKVVFYDFFSLDNRGLTQQYLRALIKKNYDILYITYEKNDKYKSSTIVSELKEYANASIYYIRENEYIDAAIELYKVIHEFNANKALIHTSPADVVGVLAFCGLVGKVDRYLINITDHAFWLGKCSADYFIEFRSYGVSVSERLRGINKDKLLLLPYYPLQDNKIGFQGFPFDHEGKKVIFSGGGLHKIYGDPFFLNSIKSILQAHEDVVFLYAGHGDDETIQNFIKENQLEKRLYFIHERKDIAEIFKRIYFYLDTFPIHGGLMCQLAVVSGKVPISYDYEESQSKIDGVFLKRNNVKITFTDIKEYFDEINRLIIDEKYLKFREDEISDLIISESQFAITLDSCLNELKSGFLPDDEVDVELINYDIYLQYLNKYPKQYYVLFIKKHSIRLALSFPKYFTRGILYKFSLRFRRKK